MELSELVEVDVETSDVNVAVDDAESSRIEEGAELKPGLELALDVVLSALELSAVEMRPSEVETEVAEAPGVGISTLDVKV